MVSAAAKGDSIESGLEIVFRGRQVQEAGGDVELQITGEAWVFSRYSKVEHLSGRRIMMKTLRQCVGVLGIE